METKLIAAEIATAAGVTTIITSSKDPSNISRIMEYNTVLNSGTSTPLQSSSGRSSPLGHTSSAGSTPTPPSILPRPPHTLFKPSPTPLRDLKSWTSHTLHPAGDVIIDSGAHQVLSRRESGGRLLAAGVLGVRGAFASGQAVRILVRRARELGKVERVVEATQAREAYLSGAETEPGTPALSASESMSSSISTIDGMLDTSSVTFTHDEMTPSMSQRVLLEEEYILLDKDKDDSEKWEVDEVGRGLANYNSAQIARVKGLKRFEKRSSVVLYIG
jgi:glutamate 5-kinase